MKFGHIELFVKDTEASLNFFINVLGFELEADQGDSKWVKIGNIEILLRLQAVDWDILPEMLADVGMGKRVCGHS